LKPTLGKTISAVQMSNETIRDSQRSHCTSCRAWFRDGRAVQPCDINNWLYLSFL